MSLTIISRLLELVRVRHIKEKELPGRSMWSKFQCRLPGGFWVPVSPVGPDYTPDSLVSPRSETLVKPGVPG